MSKVGKRAFLLLLAIPIVINVMAQDTKKPTLEDLIPGGESYRYAENLYGLQWWGDECIKPGIDTIYSIQPQTGKETMLITREQIKYPVSTSYTISRTTGLSAVASLKPKRKTKTTAPPMEM